VNVQIDADDLLRLEANIKAKRLPHTEGFSLEARLERSSTTI
jgi:hypothetical protein